MMFSVLFILYGCWFVCIFFLFATILVNKDVQKVATARFRIILTVLPRADPAVTEVYSGKDKEKFEANRRIVA